MLTSMRVRNFRSIVDSGDLPLGRITLLIGPNNSGKSSLLRSIYAIQSGAPVSNSDIRLGERYAEAWLKTDPIPERIRPDTGSRTVTIDKGYLGWTLDRQAGGGITAYASLDDPAGDAGRFTMSLVPAQIPNNFIFPVLAGRRQALHSEQIRREQALTVNAMDNNLVSRMSLLSNAAIPEARRFRELCELVLGTSLELILVENGMQQVGFRVGLSTDIPLDAMGSGVSAALSLLVSLSIAKDHVFLVEEPENDLHPKALKALLEQIMGSPNQFIVSTHSNVVLSKLGSVAGQWFYTSQRDRSALPFPSFVSSRPPRIESECFKILGMSLLTWSWPMDG